MGVFTGGDVQDSADLRRILALPRRTHDPAFVAELVRDFTAALKTPHGTMELRPIQAITLYEIHRVRGLLAPIGVGFGKTLCSVLAPRVLAARRPLLLVPASLREKTLDDIEALRRHWYLPPFIRIESYEYLSRVGAAALLTRYQPDVIIADEAHRLKSSKAACTKRIKRYLQDHESCRFLAMSGTLTKRSLKDYAHLSAWALRELSPLPLHFPALMEWSGALDEGGAIRVLGHGALAQLGTPTEPVYDQNSARRAFRRRLVETPGVVATTEGALDVSLEIDALVFNDPAPPAIEAAMEELRAMWRMPDGRDVMDGVEVWRHARELALGFWYRWDPAAPEEWMKPRAAWAKQVREVLKSNKRAIDTELQLKQAIADHRDWYPDAARALDAWAPIEPTFRPNTVPVWISDHAIEIAEQWARAEKGIVWIQHGAFGARFAQLTGIPCYGEEGLDVTGNGKRIDHHPPGTPLAALIQSNCTGRNLQAWNKNLIVSPPTAGLTWEQMLGRTHRPGQAEDTVFATVMFGCWEHVNAWNKAVKDAEYAVHSLGGHQKILYADRTFNPDQLLQGKDGPLWMKTSPMQRSS